MKLFTKTTVLTVSLLTLAGVNYANASWQSFDQMDKNKDGVLDKSEARPIAGLSFKSADTDNDGRISQSEYQAVVAKQGGQDTNPSTSGSMSDTDSGMKPGSSVGTATPGDSSSSNSSSDSTAYSSGSRSYN